jgi:PAS domain S-box-containing protein
MFAQQLEDIHWRLAELYQGANSLIEPPIKLLPVAFKELGIASEELQVAVEELHQQNEELAAARMALEAECQRYQELFDFAPDGYLVIDAAGVIQEANRVAAKLLKVSQRFLVGKPLFIFLSENERQIFHFKLGRLQQAEQVQEWWVVSLKPRDGEPFKAALTVANVRDWEGKVVGLRICVRDMIEPKQAEVGLTRNYNGPTFARPRHIYLKGEIIPLKPQIIWQACQGIVKLSTLCENGEQVIVGLAGPLMPFGLDLTSLKTYQATALSEVQLVCFSLTDLANSLELAQMILPQINQRLRQTEAFLAISGQRQVKQRFHNLLQLLKQEIGQPVKQGTRLSVRLTHQDLADACSTTRVTITRLLGKLQEQGAITIDSNHHIILTEQGSGVVGVRGQGGR